MTALLFLLSAFVIAAIGIGILALAHRKPSQSSMSSIDEFARQKSALAPRRLPGGRESGTDKAGAGRGPVNDAGPRRGA